MARATRRRRHQRDGSSSRRAPMGAACSPSMLRRWLPRPPSLENPMLHSGAMLDLSRDDFRAARARIAPHIKRTPLLTSRQLDSATGFDVRLKAEVFQRVGSYKIRGPLNKLALMSEADKRRGV